MNAVCDVNVIYLFSLSAKISWSVSPRHTSNMLNIPRRNALAYFADTSNTFNIPGTNTPAYFADTSNTLNMGGANALAYFAST